MKKYLLIIVLLGIAGNGAAYTNKEAIEPLFFHADSLIWNKMDNGEYAIAREMSVKVLERAKAVNSRFILARAYNTAGAAYLYSAIYPEALRYLFIALKLKDEIDDPDGKANVYNNIASVYYAQNEYDKALEMFVNALKCVEKTGFGPAISACSNNIGLVSADKGDYKDALVHFKKSFLIDSAEGRTEGMALSYLNFGRAYFDLKEYSKAKESYDKGLQLAREIKDTYIISKILLNSTTVDIHFNDPSAAELKAMEAMKLAEMNDNIAESRDSYFTLQRIDSCRKDFESAYFNYLKYIRLKDKVSNEEYEAKSAEARIQYEFDKKEALLRIEQEKKEAVLRAEKDRQVLLRNSFMGGFCLVLVLGSVSFRAYRAKRKANIEVNRQKEEIFHQKNLVEEKNKEIVDSINYAKRLQAAILPPQHLINSCFPESFVLFRPKDIVAGDFYFFETTGETQVIAAADCTGHGVPGAMVSVICCNALTRAVKEFGLKDPGQILDKATSLVIETFEKSELSVTDGMDISLLVIQKNNSGTMVKWAGANNSLFMLRPGEDIAEIKGTKQPVGKFDRKIPFETHTVNVKESNQLYLVTDGFADQFGGPKGKKFRYTQLREMLKETSIHRSSDQKKIIEERFESWKQGYEQTDDVTLIRITI